MLLLTQSQPVPAVLATAIEQQLARVLEAFAAAQKEPRVRPVHDLRVAIRRLTGALELAEAIGQRLRRRSRRVLRELLTVLSPLRDAQVQARALRDAPADRALHEVQEQLRRQERALRRDTKRSLRRLRLGKLGKDVARLNHALLHDTPSAEVVEHALLGELARRQLELDRRRLVGEPDDARALHRSRLALKDYRYVLEVLAPLLPPSSETLRVATSELQAQLGQAHDQHVLSELVRGLSRTASRRLAASLEALADELERQSLTAQLAGATSLRNAKLQFPA
jgi:CHAD domain-containing protein